MAFICPGAAGIALVIAVQLGVVTCMGLTALWGLLASITSPRTAIAIAGLLLLTTPLLLPRYDHAPAHERELASRHT